MDSHRRTVSWQTPLTPPAAEWGMCYGAGEQNTIHQSTSSMFLGSQAESDSFWHCCHNGLRSEINGQVS
jgi:hypothetical protein